jgi:hypothetical protein
MRLEECAVCGRDTRAGLRYLVGRRRDVSPDGDTSFVCRVCRNEGLSLPSGAGRDEVPITMPNPNLPITH